MSEEFFRNRREAAYRGAFAFLDGKRFHKNNIISDGTVIYSYGRHFPMATRISDSEVWVNSSRYSVTTGKHQSALRTALSVAGFEPDVPMLSPRGTEGYLWSKT